ncbi:MAG TPA: hypothetical protein VF210_18370 [Pseudomonadales bacterium]
MAATHISVPPWTGKALGAAAALVFAPAQPGSLLWWLTAGLALGHGFDSLGSHLAPRRPAPTPLPQDARASLRYTFAALGRVAAAGDPGAAPLGLAESLMTRLAFLPERRREALGWFEAGRDPAFPFDTLADACRDAFAEHPVLQGLARRSLCRMAALIDTPGAMRELLALGARLGWDRQRLVDEAMSALRDGETDRSGWARRVLGVQPDDAPDVVRLAYRRRVARWHPDRLPARAAPEERAAAERRMAQLRDALECLLGG